MGCIKCFKACTQILTFFIRRIFFTQSTIGMNIFIGSHIHKFTVGIFYSQIVCGKSYIFLICDFIKRIFIACNTNIVLSSSCICNNISVAKKISFYSAKVIFTIGININGTVALFELNFCITAISKPIVEINRFCFSAMERIYPTTVMIVISFRMGKGIKIFQRCIISSIIRGIITNITILFKELACLINIGLGRIAGTVKFFAILNEFPVMLKPAILIHLNIISVFGKVLVCAKCSIAVKIKRYIDFSTYGFFSIMQEFFVDFNFSLSGISFQSKVECSISPLQDHIIRQNIITGCHIKFLTIYGIIFTTGRNHICIIYFGIISTQIGIYIPCTSIVSYGKFCVAVALYNFYISQFFTELFTCTIKMILCRSCDFCCWIQYCKTGGTECRSFICRSFFVQTLIENVIGCRSSSYSGTIGDFSCSIRLVPFTIRYIVHGISQHCAIYTDFCTIDHRLAIIKFMQRTTIGINVEIFCSISSKKSVIVNSRSATGILSGKKGNSPLIIYRVIGIRINSSSNIDFCSSRSSTSIKPSKICYFHQSGKLEFTVIVKYKFPCAVYSGSGCGKNKEFTILIDILGNLGKFFTFCEIQKAIKYIDIRVTYLYSVTIYKQIPVRICRNIQALNRIEIGGYVYRLCDG